MDIYFLYILFEFGFFYAKKEVSYDNWEEVLHIKNHGEKLFWMK